MSRILQQSGDGDSWLVQAEAALGAIEPQPEVQAGPQAQPAPEPEPESQPDPEPKPALAAIAAEGVPPPFYMTERASGKRRYQRYDAEFRVILVSGGRSFRTFSSNVSVGGMLLRQNVPAPMLNQVCRVFIGSVDSNENIELSCRVIGDPQNPRRLSFGDCDPVALKRLESWILGATAAAKAA